MRSDEELKEVASDILFAQTVDIEILTVAEYELWEDDAWHPLTDDEVQRVDELLRSAQVKVWWDS